MTTPEQEPKNPNLLLGKEIAEDEPSLLKSEKIVTKAEFRRCPVLSSETKDGLPKEENEQSISEKIKLLGNQKKQLQVKFKAKTTTGDRSGEIAKEILDLNNDIKAEKEKLKQLQKAKPISTVATGEPTIADADKPKSTESVAPQVDANAGPALGVETGLSQEEQEKIIEEGLENLGAIYDNDQAEKEAEAESLRQEIINLVEKSKKLDEALGRDGGKIKELIEENEEANKINERVEALLLETEKSKNTDRLKAIKKEILDNLLSLEKEKTSLAWLGRQMETINSVVEIAGWPLKKAAEVTGKGARGGGWLLRKGGPLAGKGGVLGLAVFGAIIKDLWKLAKIEAKIAWKGITGHKVSLLEGWKEVFKKEEATK